MDEIKKQRIKTIGEQLRAIQRIYYTPTSRISRDTGVNQSTLSLIINYLELDYSVSDEKLEKLESWIKERI